MSLTITKKEYHSLLDMMAIADWIMEAYTLGEKQYSHHHELRKKIYSHFKEMGAEDKIEYETQFTDYFLSKSYEEYILNEFIETYEENYFWDELIDKLAERDVIDTYGEETYKAMEGIKRIEVVEKAKQYYEEKFEKEGIKKLYIKE